MSEERKLGDLPEARASSFKVALLVAGAVIGLGLLLCGGVAAYVAGTGSSAEPAAAPLPPTPLHSESYTDPATIAAIDLPPDFEQKPLPTGDALSPLKSVLFGPKTDGGAELVIARVDLSSAPAQLTPEQLRGMALKRLEMTGKLGKSFHRAADSVDTERELSVLGRQTSIEITDGRLGPGGKPVMKVTGWFSTQQAHIGVIFMIPRDEYDEEAVVKMLESIQPRAGDSIPEANGAARPAE